MNTTMNEQPVDESLIIDPTVSESDKESFADVKYEEESPELLESCVFSSDSILLSRKSFLGDRITMAKSFEVTIKAAQLQKESTSDNKNNSPNTLATNHNRSILAALHSDPQKLKHKRRLFTSLSEFELIEGNIPLTPGEKIIGDFVTEISFVPYSGFSPSRMILTSYRLIFVPTAPLNSTFKANLRSDTFVVPFPLIDKVEKYSDKKSSFSNSIEIETKDGRVIRINFHIEQYSGFLKFSDLIDKVPYAATINDFFAFKLFEHDPALEIEYRGWSLYNLEKDFSRQGIYFSKPADIDVEEEPIYKKIQNRSPSGLICETYPPEFVVPALMKTEELIECSKFRSKERLPVMVYSYRINEEGETATLWRASQCLGGIIGSRSVEDELMVRLIGNPRARNSPEKDPMGSLRQYPDINVHIYDLRPFLNAFAQKVTGKGYENTNNYKNAEIRFMDISNIHAVRESHNKLLTLIQNLDNDKFPSILESSSWLQYISSILNAANTIVEKSLKKGVAALVHCSDGWDRTTQIASLIQLMVDPYYRSFEGFEVLIEKDWVSFGHQFRLRHCTKNRDEKDQKAPIFLQFLDCVHQLHNQFPHAFEFNLNFLSDLAYFSYTSLFGTFICDRYEEISQNQLDKRTLSVWSFLNSRRKLYLNPLYNNLLAPISAAGNRNEIFPNTSIHAMRFWREHFLYYHNEVYLTTFNDLEISSKWDFYELSMEYQNQQLESTERDNQYLRKKMGELIHENKAIKQRLEELSPGEVIPSKGVSSTVKIQQKLPGRGDKIKENEFVVVEDDAAAN